MAATSNTNDPAMDDLEKGALASEDDSTSDATTTSTGVDGLLAVLADGPKPAANVVEYKTMGWTHAGIVMIAETVSLGILSLPRSLADIGYVPGVILIVVLGVIATYTGYVVWQYKMEHRHVTSFADCLSNIFGRSGRVIGEVLQATILVFVMAAHILTFSVLMNTLTDHGLCTNIFSVIGTVVSFIVSLPRTLKCNSYISIFSCASIAAATMIAMIGIGISRPGLNDSYAVTPSELTGVAKGGMAVSTMILAYQGHIAYPQIIDEMRKPEDFPKALILLQSVTITLYTVVAVVIYYFAGQDVEAPAINSASHVVRKIAFGIATPTIIVAGVIAALIAAKQIYTHVWTKNPDVKKEKSFRARGSWYAILAVLYVLAWIIASVIPNFHQLLSLIGAMFGTWFAMGFCSMFWLQLNWKGTFKESYGVNWRMRTLATLNVVILVMGFAICVLGMYGSLKDIVSSETGRGPFSCANNIDSH